MKKIIATALVSVVLFSGFTASAQGGTAQQEDKSKRASPPNKLVMSSPNGLKVTIDYSQPSVKGRTVGKDIAPYGQVWRTGANEATTFEVNRDVKVEGKDLKAGKYALFTIPGENEWVIIFNSMPTQWGAFKYEQSKDVLRVNAKPKKAKTFTERMTFTNTGDNIALLWGNTEVNFSVK